jgi:hypothetical protein
MTRQILNAFDDQGAPSNNTAKALTASPTAQISYARPAVYTAPSPIAQPNWNPAPQQNALAGGGGGGGAAAASMAAPAAPPRINYGGAEYLNGSKDSELDGTFHDQASMYASKLKKYVADYEAQAGKNAYGQDAASFDMKNLGGSMGVDHTNAQQGIARNKDQGLRGLSEDFANRGMINSGLYGRDFDVSRDQYDRQGQNLDQGTRNQLQTLGFNRGNQETDNVAQIGAARRDALNRLAQAQSL